MNEILEYFRSLIRPGYKVIAEFGNETFVMNDDGKLESTTIHNEVWNSDDSNF